MNSTKFKLQRMIAYRDSYNGLSVVEARSRNNAVKELWASLPSKKDREAFRKACGIVV